MNAYFPQYQANVLGALAPRVEPASRAVFGPMPWQAHLSGTGAIVAAVGDLAPDPASLTRSLHSIMSTLQQANLGNLERALVLPYYSRSLRTLTYLPPFAEVAQGLGTTLKHRGWGWVV